MTQEQINEGNKLIAEFMGYKLITPEMRREPSKWSRSYWENPDFKGSSKGVLCREDGLSYDNSWNWIMPVVEKIESMGFWFNIKKNHVSVCFDNKGTFDSKLIVSEFGDQTKIERVYNCIIYTIKYISYKKGVE